VALPQGSWRDVLTGEAVTAEKDPTTVAQILARFPFAVLRQVRQAD
jgi:maltooligosyltrehalose synthase